MRARVLIIDDDTVFRSLAARMVRAAGLLVVGEAGDVAEGTAAADELRPDAAIVDVGLPDGDGLALAGVLAALPWSPRVLVVSSDAENAFLARRGPNALPFVAKANLPDVRLDELLAGG
jgi:DNA-binding NarL/FixJ family response regulator